MIMKSLGKVAVAAVALTSAWSGAWGAGYVVASGDEWQLSDSAFNTAYAPSTTVMLNEITTAFGGSKYLLIPNIYVGPSSFTHLVSHLQGQGKTVTFGTGESSDFSGYDAVLHFGARVSSTAPYASFVAGGGNLYLSLGGGEYPGGSEPEAEMWNPFLASHGIVGGNNWFHLAAPDAAAITTGPAGMTELFWNYGQSMDVLAGSSAISYVRGSFNNGPADIGLIAANRAFALPAGVPEPATWGLMIIGFGAIGTALRRRKRITALPQLA